MSVHTNNVQRLATVGIGIVTGLFERECVLTDEKGGCDQCGFFIVAQFFIISRSYCTQYDRLLASHWRLSVCLFFCLWRCALQLNDSFYGKSVWTRE